MAMTRKAISVGVIGCGHVTHTWHLPALRHVSGVKVTALADIDSGLLARAADQYNISNRYTDYRDLLSDPSIEAVAVCVPAGLHVDIALATIEAGKHLLIEKPLALGLDECDVLIEKAREAPLVAMVGFNLRWHRLVQEALRVIREGKLGPIRMIRSMFTCGTEHAGTSLAWRKQREAGGGTLIEMAVHHFDLWRLLLGSEVEEVFSLSRSRASDDDTATVAAKMDNGILASLDLSEETGAENELEIFGEKGRLRVSLTRYDGIRFFSRPNQPGDLRTHLEGMTHSLGELTQVLRRLPQPSDWADAFRCEWAHFMAAIKGREKVGCTLMDGRHALTVALAAVESASTGIPVKVSEAPRKITPVTAYGDRRGS